MGNSAHANQILSILKHPVPATGNLVHSSWQRCVEAYGLDPHRIAPPTVLSSVALADYRQPIDDLLALARDEVDRLFLRLRDHHFAVTFTDSGGVTLLMRCAESEWDHYRTAGVIVGSIWSEESQGTNGIGTCIKEGRPLSIVMDEHFSPSLSTVSCTAAPVLGPSQCLAALLNVTAMVPTTHGMQDMVRDIVHRSARRIENIYFDRRHDGREVFRLSRHGDFNDLASEERLAVDRDGRVVEVTLGASRMLHMGAEKLAGLPVDEVFGQSLQVKGPLDQATRIATMDNGSRIFLRPLVTRPAASTPQPSRAPARSAAKAPEQPAAEEFAALLGNDPLVIERFKVIQRLVNRRLPVLLQGETGTGKSSLAKLLHRNSIHASGNLVSLNCAAIPPELIESELFGYRSGAFTGASKQGYKGRLMEADGGTLFLDEIGDMPLALQTRFLHVLSDGEFVPIGSTQPVRIEMAVISASLHDIAALVREGRFREDLYFRLNGATRTLPPLRQRSDRRQIIESVFRDEGLLAGIRRLEVNPDVYRTLEAYHWPGNIRELRHVARFAVTFAEANHVGLDCLPAPFDSSEDSSAAGETASNTDRRILQIALDQSGWNVSETAKRLGISRSTLHRKMKGLGLQRFPRAGDLN